MQFSNINYNLYKSFLVVYEMQNISKAAEFLYISQPAVSHNIKELEKQLGVQLFYKKSNGMSTTNEADILYRYISSAFNSIMKAEMTISNMAHLKTGVVKIGIPTHLSVLYLSKEITSFRQAHPNVKIEIINKPINDLLILLQSQNIDLVIDSQPISYERTKFEVKFLSSFEHCFFTTEKFYDESAICIDNIKQKPLIVTSLQNDEIRLLKHAIGHTKLNPIIEAGTTESVIKLVKEGNGIGYAQEEYVKDDIENGNLKKLNISFTLPKLDIYCGYIPENLSFAPKKFIDFLSEKD